MHLAHSLPLQNEKRRCGFKFVRSMRLPVHEPCNRCFCPVCAIFLPHFTIAHEHQPYRTFSVELPFSIAPEDLMTKFIDCLVRLPNLKTLEILSVSSRAPISKALRRKYAIFPSIRILRITHACHHFIRNCPNLEDLTFTTGLDTHAPTTIRSHGKGLRRIAGVDVYCPLNLSGELEKIVWSGKSLRGVVSQRLFGAARTFERSALLVAPE